jgi:hypothetical protein
LQKLPEPPQTMLNETMEFQLMMLPDSGVSLIEKGMAFQKLNLRIIYLTKTVLEQAGEEQTLDRGTPWFVPHTHPCIAAVRIQTDENFQSWQVQENQGNMRTTVTVSITDKSEWLHITVFHHDSKTEQTTKQILSLKLKYPQEDVQVYSLVSDVIITRWNNATPEQPQTLVYKNETIDITSKADFWIRDSSHELFV